MKTRTLLLTVITAASLAAAPAAHAGRSVESLKFVTIYNPPGGGTPIVHETCAANTAPGSCLATGPNGVVGLTQINVDADSAPELTANVSLSLNATTLAISGQLEIWRSETGLLGTPPPLPTLVEAVAVLSTEKEETTVRQNVSIGYDARTSNAPGRWTLNLESCTTPNCRTQPTACAAPCVGTLTTLGVNATDPPRCASAIDNVTPQDCNSLKLIGELSTAPKEGAGRQDPIRGEINLGPMPDASSPLVFGLWSAKTTTPDHPSDPEPTAMQASMTGNKQATKADVHVCQITGRANEPGSGTYVPRQVGHNACDAAGYADRRFDSRIVDATIDKLPRTTSNAAARTAVTFEDNDRGKAGGLQKLRYDATQPVDLVTVTDRATRWQGSSRRTSDNDYVLTRVPTWIELESLDESDLSRSDPIKKHQTLTYKAGGSLTSVDVTATDRTDGAVTKKQTLRLETVPARLKVEAKETASRSSDEALDRQTGEALRLIETSSPIGVIEYSTANVDAEPDLPDGLPAAYVFTSKAKDDGPAFTKLRMLGAREGTFELGRYFHFDHDTLGKPDVEPREVSKLELLSVKGLLAPSAFRTYAVDGDRVYDVHVNDLPSDLTFKLEPLDGSIEYAGSQDIGSLTVELTDPKPVFKRANRLWVALQSVPRNVRLRYPHDGNKRIDMRVTDPDAVGDPQIGRMELIAHDSGRPGDVPTEAIDTAVDDGVVIRDLEGIAGVEDQYLLYALVHGLRGVTIDEFDHDRDHSRQMVWTSKSFTLDSTAGRRFVYDSDTTDEIREYTWESGHDPSDPDAKCDSEPVARRLEHTRAVIHGLQPLTRLSLDKHHAYGKRECFENAVVCLSSPCTPLPYNKDEVKEIVYTASRPTGQLEFLTTGGASNVRVNLSSLPDTLRFCKADQHGCLPDIGLTYGADQGSLAFQASDYTTLNMVDCGEKSFSNGSCSDAATRITDLEMKRLEFWMDQDKYSGDLYLNTADVERIGSSNNPFRGGRVRTEDMDFRFGNGFYARGAHIKWDNIWDDERTNWGRPDDPDGGTVHCPAGTNWEVKIVGVWWDTTDDWCGPPGD